MSTIKSRDPVVTQEAIDHAKIELAAEVAVELDVLVDKIDAFLEMRIAAEFDELKEDIDQLILENMELKNEITQLVVENIKLHVKLASNP